MILHLLKMVWRRKAANALVMAEILLSFLIVFAVVTLSGSLIARWQKPLGFDWRNVWVIEIENLAGSGESNSRAVTDEGLPREELREAARISEAAERLIRELKSFPEVESAGAAAMLPYTGNTWTAGFAVNGRNVLVTVDHVTDDFASVMNIRPLRGRWFSREDEGQNYEPVVVDTDAARAMFDDEDPVGQRFSADDFLRGSKATKEFRVVGLIAPFRQDGEFSDNNVKMSFFRASFVRPTPPNIAQVVVRMRPGTPGAFEAELNRRLSRLTGITYRIRRMENMRASSIKARIVPIGVLILIAAFLITMVALGLTGVLWQTVTRRMREMGLRRAVGASGRSIRMQVMLEVALLATLSVALGAIIILQLPLLGIFGLVSPREFAVGFIGGLVVIYAITTLCSAYPSWLASTIEPADALRYE